MAMERALAILLIHYFQRLPSHPVLNVLLGIPARQMEIHVMNQRAVLENAHKSLNP